MLKILNYKPLEKENSKVKAIVDVEIVKWCLEIRGCTVLESNGRRWVNFPQRKETDLEGKATYIPSVSFSSVEYRRRFEESFFAAVDQHLKDNPHLAFVAESQSALPTPGEVPF